MNVGETDCLRQCELMQKIREKGYGRGMIYTRESVVGSHRIRIKEIKTRPFLICLCTEHSKEEDSSR